MLSRASLMIFVGTCLHAWAGGPATFSTTGTDPGAWPRILGSVGFQSVASGQADINVVRAGTPAAGQDWLARVEAGGYLILEGDSGPAHSLGFRPTSRRLQVLNVEELSSPQLQIVWERPAETPVFEIPAAATVFARERHSQAPLAAGFRHGAGGVLWVALSPGQRGYERFPGLMAALLELGLAPPFRTNRLWAFFDSSYRARADLEYLAERWRLAGIRGLHVAAWHFHEPDPARDGYLRNLILSCHRRGILVYAWLELPHVSEKFWADHPEWREKTALLEDAHLDWRKLMNLRNRQCFQAASREALSLLERFDWDGVNLAELYFESLQGHENPSRFTPMNQEVRREFQSLGGFDPVELFDNSSPRHHVRNPRGLREFLEFRAELLRQMQDQWLAALGTARRSKPDLDIVLTGVDDRIDRRMRDAVGADAGSVLPLLGRHPFTFLIEDPATLWHLGPERYREVAARYGDFAAHRDRLAIDLNIVDRYQDVYPTKQQTGLELYQLVSQAAGSFPRVALYFENSIRARDVRWLASAAAVVERYRQDGANVIIQASHPVGVRWRGPAQVDGRPWPAQDDETVWIPAGSHRIGPSAAKPAVRLMDFTGDLTSAASLARGLEFAYRSAGRAYAVLDQRPRVVRIDGALAQPGFLEYSSRVTLALPAGRHQVRIETERD